MSGIVAQNTLDGTGLVKSPEAAGGAWTFISKLTASGSATLSFTSGLDSTYKEYRFYFVNIHPENEGDGVKFSFNFSVDGGSNYNVTKTTTAFRAYHNESDASAVGYRTGSDLAQGTGGQLIAVDTGHDNDESNSGELWLFNPSSTTFVKHFMSKFNSYNGYVVVSYADSHYAAGYGNTTSAVDAVQFKNDSGTMDSGTIKLFGIKDS